MLTRTLLGAAAYLFATASVAYAGEEWFVEVHGGGAYLQDADNTGTFIDIESTYDLGFEAGGALGYAFEQFRIEGEVTYRQNAVDELTVTRDAAFGLPTGLVVDPDGEVTSLAFMANGFYDFDTGSPLRPYLGGGIGFASIEADVTAGGVQLVDENTGVLAYQAMAGVSYEISDGLAVFGGYRFFGTQDPGLTDAAGGGGSLYPANQLDRCFARRRSPGSWCMAWGGREW